MFFHSLKAKILWILQSHFIDYVDEWYISEIDSPRALDIKEIISSLYKQRENVTYHSFKNTEKAFTAAYKKSDDNDNIIAFGSFFIVSEILKDVIQYVKFKRLSK